MCTPLPLSPTQQAPLLAFTRLPQNSLQMVNNSTLMGHCALDNNTCTPPPKALCLNLPSPFPPPSPLAPPPSP